jgi:HPt (histidine-containing phosphotransfer) domain-containing protein
MKIPLELKRKYLDRHIHALDNLVQSLENNDFTPALTLGHQIKGNAATFEFPQIAPLGRRMEKAAKELDRDEVSSLVLQLSSEISKARFYLLQ